MQEAESKKVSKGKKEKKEKKESPYADLPVSFTSRLTRDTIAASNYVALQTQQRQAVINYVRSASSKEEAKERMTDAVTQLKDNNIQFFSM